jgi:uncharacterized protein (TIGR03067 family)
VHSTVQAATLFCSGRTGTATKVTALAEGFLESQFLGKWAKVAGLGVAGLLVLLLLLLTLTLNLSTEPEQQPTNLAQAPKPKTDQELLQGTWKVAKLWFGGREVVVADLEMVFAGDQIAQRGEGRALQASFRLDPGKDPKEIDFLFPQRVTRRGIYRVEGDHMLLCWNLEGPERPADFTGKRFYYYELRRQLEH